MAYKSRTMSKQNPKFTLFRKLPPELRNQIWVLSLPDPRIVALQKHCQPIPRSVRYSSTTSQTNSGQESVTIYRSQTFVPIISAVCRESRAIVEQSYALAFRTDNSPGTWIDFQRDVLYIPHEIYRDGSDFYENFQQDVKQVRTLQSAAFGALILKVLMESIRLDL